MKTIGLMLGVALLWVSGAAAKEVPFPQVAGWEQSAEIQTFEPQTLYEYINGAADLYLACDFQELKVAEYRNARKTSVTVEAYRHATPRDAFGIYSQERLPDGNFIGIGAQGYIDKNILNFVAGSYYVKINSFNTGEEDPEVLQTFAKKVAEALGERGGGPAPLFYFPAEGKRRHSEKYIARSFLGYAFFSSAFTADYEIAGKTFKLFLIEAKDENECREILRQYLRQIQGLEGEPGEGRHTVADPHHGIIDLYWKGAYIWGTYDLADDGQRSKYLKLFEDKMRAQRQGR